MSNLATSGVHDFERLFNPRTIAIVGASANANSISGQPLKYLLANGYTGHVYPVNPRYREINGLTCYPDVASLPETPDAVLVVVAAKHVLEALEQCGARGVAFAIILSSGFAEIGEAGKAAQARISEIADRYGLGVIGPNCQGMMNIADNIRLGFGGPFGMSYRKGSVSLVSQSGAFGNAVLMLAEAGGLGFRRYLSTGNESCINSLDVIEHLIADPGTRLIAAYVEGLKEAHRLIDVARSALRADKPLLIWKVGNSVAGAKAAASHTANLCGAPSLYRAAFQQSGVIEVRDIDDLTDCAQALLTGARPHGRRVAIVTLSGGAGIAMADRCEELDLALPAFDDTTLKGLAPLLSKYATAQNPLDLTAGLGSDVATFDKILRIVTADPNIDIIGLPMAATSGVTASRFAEVIAAVHAETGKPIFVAWNARRDDAALAFEHLEQAGVPRYSTPARCVHGMAATANYAQARRELTASSIDVPFVRHNGAIRKQLAHRDSTLTEYESKIILESYGINITQELLASNRQQAISYAALIGKPVAMKIQSPDLPHKTEAGGVQIGLRGSETVGRAFDDIIARALVHAPKARVNGVLIQEMVTGGVEVIVGVANSPQFGQTLMFGLGGIFTEVLKDVVFRIAPINRREAMQMIHGIKAFEVLNGARGRPKADIDALCDTLLRVSALAVDLKDELGELDINPLFVLPKGQGVVAGDALIRPLANATFDPQRVGAHSLELFGEVQL